MTSALYNVFKKWAIANPVAPAGSSAAGKSWSGYCALGVAWFIRKNFGWSSEGGTWGPGAKDVGNASKPLNKNHAAAPKGAFHFWSRGTYGHTGIDLNGGGTDVGMFGTASLKVKFVNYGGVQSVSGYGLSDYMGWSTNYGGKTFNVPSDSLPYQRVVGEDGINEREFPSVNSKVLRHFNAGDVLDMESFVVSNAVGGNPYGVSNKWAVSKYSKKYFYLGSFTDSGTSGLTNGGVYNDPVVENLNKRVVGDTILRLREYPTTSSVVKGAANPDEILTINEYCVGETVSSNPNWGKDSATGFWLWLGGLTNTTTNGLKLIATPVDANPIPDRVIPTGWEFNTDLSYYQRTINHKVLKDAGIFGAVVKTTGADEDKPTASSRLYIAENFVTHTAGLEANGIKVDFYHWQDALVPAEVQADFHWNTIKEVAKEGSMSWLDWESWGSANPLMSLDEALVYLNRLKANSGGRLIPGIYANTSQLKSNDFSKIINAGFPLWVANYGSNNGKIAQVDPVIGQFHEFAQWQYTSVGKIAGYTGELDLNIARPDMRGKYGFKPLIVVEPPVVVDPPVVIEPEEPIIEPPVDPELPEEPVVTPAKPNGIAALVGFAVIVIAGIVAWFVKLFGG